METWGKVLMQKQSWLKKIICFGIIVLFVGSGVVSAFYRAPSITSKPLNRDIWLYVGGSGPGNYTTIQSALDAANPGDTVFVYSGIYYENVVINNNHLALIGENKNTTIIDGSQIGNVVSFNANYTIMTGFTIRNSGSGLRAGLRVYSSNNTITGNTVTNNAQGISIWHSKGSNIISENIITNNSAGILILNSGNNTIADNSIFHNDIGVQHFVSINDHLTNNTFSSRVCDITLDDVTSSTFADNNFSNCLYGINLYHAVGNTFSRNRFINSGLIVVESSYQNVVMGNTINGKSLVYLEGMSDGVIDNSTNVGQIILINCSNMTIRNQELTYVPVGVELYNTHHCLIKNNAVSNGSYGILLNDFSQNNIITNNMLTANTIQLENGGCGIMFFLNCDQNTVTNNTISNNLFGVSISASNSNHLYHNNFINNIEYNAFDEANNTWDNDYFSEGNFWTDYTGVDGNGDDIGDTPYNISGGSNQDLYPLMTPFGPPRAEFTYSIIDKLVSFNASTSYDYDGIITNYSWDFGDQTTGQGQTITHTYAMYQTYTVTLTVTDDDGSTDTCSKAVTLSDFFPPELSNIHDYPDPQHLNQLVTITCTAVDNVAVSTVKVQITAPDLTTTNQTMTYNLTTHSAFYNATYPLEGIFSYFIWANDTSGNSISSPLFSFDITNEQPYVPSNQNPSNGTINVATTILLSWTGGDSNPDDTVTYDIYFGTTSPPPKVINNLSGGTSYEFSSLDYNTTYYWKIQSWDNHGAYTTGPQWSFTTLLPNNPPNTPSNPNPSNGQTSVPITTDLSWACSDPDPQDVLTYDVYFGITNPPPKQQSNHTMTTYEPGTLSFGTTYYWKIVAWDNHHTSTNGPVWYFTTDQNGAPIAPIINGPNSGNAGTTYWYTFVAIDPEQDDIRYQIDWGDGTIDPWTNLSHSNEVITKNHTWVETGTYLIKARAKDINGAIGPWGTMNVRMPLDFRNVQSQDVSLIQTIRNQLTR